MRIELTEVEFAFATNLLEQKQRAYLEADIKCDRGFVTILKAHGEEWVENKQLRMEINDGKAALYWDEQPAQETE